MSNLKEYVKSSLITFVAAFSVAILGNWHDQSLTHDALFALAGSGIRAGVKALFEMFALLRTKTIM